ncbi:MAG: RHS repeat-associated core domain-containing protein [Phycisphaeraceae bacterium]|nr:RHS repeat-associated core domain-containing protein [Phycisphaeraceae bacterium]
MDDAKGICLTCEIVYRLNQVIHESVGEYLAPEWVDSFVGQFEYDPKFVRLGQSPTRFPFYEVLYHDIDEYTWKLVLSTIQDEVLPALLYLPSSAISMNYEWEGGASENVGSGYQNACDDCAALCEPAWDELRGLVTTASSSGSSTGVISLYVQMSVSGWHCSGDGGVGVCSPLPKYHYLIEYGSAEVRKGNLTMGVEPLEGQVVRSHYTVYAKCASVGSGACPELSAPIPPTAAEDLIWFADVPFSSLVNLEPGQSSEVYGDYSIEDWPWSCANKPDPENGDTCGWWLVDFRAIRRCEFLTAENCTQCGDSEEVPSQANVAADNPSADDDEDCDRKSHPQSEQPVIVSTGFKSERSVDFTVDAVGQSFSFVREYTSNPALGGAKLLGENWMASCFRFIRVQTEDPKDPDVDADIVMTAPPVERKLVFEPDGMNQKWSAGGPTTRYMEKSSVTIDDETWPVWQLVEPGQSIMMFFRQPEEGESSLDEPPLPLLGLLAQEQDWYGNKRVYEYLLAGDGEDDDLKAARLCCIYLNGSPQSEERADAEIRFQWNLTDDPVLFGTLSRISVQRPKSLTETHHVRFVYGATDGETVHADVGSGRQLVQVTVHERINPSGQIGQVWRTRITQYRYHDGEEPDESEDERFEVEGPQHMLKAVILPEQVEYYAQKRSEYELWSADEALRLGANELLNMADDEKVEWEASPTNPPLVGDHFAKFVGYDNAGRVTVQYVQSGCGCGGAATQSVKQVFSYVDYASPYTGRSTRIEEYLLDDGDYSELYRTQYFDQAELGAHGTPYLVARAIKEPGGRAWVTRYAFDSERLQIRTYAPSCTPSGYVAADFDGMSPVGPTLPTLASGLVHATSFDANKRPTEHKIGPTDDSALKRVSKTTYNSTFPWLVDTIERYRVEGSTSDDDIELTTYEYWFHGSGVIAAIRTSVEAELESENGPDGEDLTYDNYALFDGRGRLRWSRAADRALLRREYALDHGALTAIIRNADPADLDGEEYGDVPTTDWGLEEASSTRLSGGELTTTFAHDASGRVIRTTSPGNVTGYTVREMREAVSRPGMLYYAQLSLPHGFDLPDEGVSGPVEMSVLSAGNRSIEHRSFAINPTGYAPPAYTLVTELSRDVTDHMISGLVAATHQWHDVNETFVSGTDSYYTSSFVYDDLGRLAQQVAANGTITERGYDVLGRVTSVSIGALPGNDAATQPVQVVQYYYDSNYASPPVEGVGNGNLTVIRALDGTTNRDTKRYFDYRDRMFKVVNPTKPYEFLVYDNLDRVVERGVFKDEPSAIDTPLADRGLFSTTAYSQRGLVYRQRVATDATDSSPSFLESHTWYDAVGRPIARWGPNAPATKTKYDAHGRVTLTAITDRGGDAAPGDSDNHADALSFEDDIVLEQVEYTYTDTGRVDTVITSHRLHDDDSTDGVLNDAIAIQTFVGYMYDGAQRPIRTLNYGTNNSSDIFENDDLPSWPLGSVPDDWNDLPAGDPIMTGVVYNERGMVRDVIDPLGRITRTFYDDLGRRIAVVENYEDASIEWNAEADLPRWRATGIDTGEDDRDRVTAFVYDGAGNVTQQIAFMQPDADAPVQVTRYVYGTSFAGTDAMHTLVPSGDLLSAVHYPDEESGEANTDPEYTVTYAYNGLGELKAVTDQNGTLHVYSRDAAGRVVTDSVEDFGTGIDEHVKSMTVDYDDFGRMDIVRSWNDAGGTGDVLNAVKFNYTRLWQVHEVFQDIDSDIDTGTPVGMPTARVEYAYPTYPAGSGNRSRLTEMGYPSNTSLEFNYDGPSVNHAISRVASLATSPGYGDSLVEYSYLGLGMFAVTDYPTPDVQLDRTLNTNGERGTTGSYYGFDRFGRVRFHAWADGSLSSGPDRPFLVAERYAYDAASNRKLKDTVQPVVGQNWNHVDWEYTYDGLDRLIEAKRGVWGGSSMSSTAAGSQKWGLDMLGNWATFKQDLDANGAYSDAADLIESREHNGANEIKEIDQTYPASATRPFGYDKAGNMTEQTLRAGEGTGIRTYVHDAWNRLVRVELDHDGAGGDAPFLTARYEYNPLHWRTVKVADRRTPTTNPDEEPESYQRRAMFYDASWRLIEEHICDEWDEDEREGDVNRVGQYFWGLRYIDDLIFRREDRDLTNEPYPAEDPAEPDFDDAETPGWFALTDVQFSVVALLTPEGRIVERVVYDPYGRGRHHFAADYDGNGAVEVPDLNGTYGHLTAWFADDMQADWDRNGTTYGDTPDIFAFQTDWFAQSGNAVAAGQISRRYAAGSGINANAPDNMIGYCGYVFNPETDDYTVRFRHYDPEIGRWLQKDPAGYVDGTSEFQYSSSSPATLVDPTGLLSLAPAGGGRWKDANEQAEARRTLQEALRRLCPTARVTASGMVYIEGDQILEKPVDEQLGNDVRSDGDCKDKCKDPPGCKILRAAIEAFPNVMIEWGPTSATNPPTFRYDHKKRKYKEGELREAERLRIAWYNTPLMQQKRDKNGKLVNDREAAGWEVLWHELIHAARWSRDKHVGRYFDRLDQSNESKRQAALEELITIDQTNELLEWYNDCSARAKDAPVPLRDPFGHGRGRPQDHDRRWLNNPDHHWYLPYGKPGPNE